MIGFETIGNATLTVFDDKPVLSTDPWVYGSPYFGSWGHKYSIPSEQITNIQNSKYIWLLERGFPILYITCHILHLTSFILYSIYYIVGVGVRFGPPSLTYI